MSSLEIIIGGLMSSFALGWTLGRGLKAFRQFMDQVS